MKEVYRTLYRLNESGEICPTGVSAKAELFVLQEVPFILQPRTSIIWIGYFNEPAYRTDCMFTNFPFHMVTEPFMRVFLDWKRLWPASLLCPDLPVENLIKHASVQLVSLKSWMPLSTHLASGGREKQFEGRASFVKLSRWYRALPSLAASQCSRHAYNAVLEVLGNCADEKRVQLGFWWRLWRISVLTMAKCLIQFHSDILVASITIYRYVLLCSKFSFVLEFGMSQIGSFFISPCCKRFCTSR